MRPISRVWVLAVFALTVALGGVVSPMVRAQSSKGTVTGTVTDPSGATIPEANVTLKDKNTGVSRQTTTNQAGIYRFDAVDLGVYDLSVRKSGFNDATFNNITIQANRIATIDAQLQLGSGTQTVEVNATASEILQTTDAVRGGNLEPVQVTSLPLPGLDSLNLMMTLPGAQSATTTQFSDGPNVSFNGSRARSNNFMIDGVENNDISVAGAAFALTNPDAIQEVSVQTSEFSAEYGRSGGAVVNQITRSGTNKLHGSANEIYQSQVFNATSNADRLGGLAHPAKFVDNTPDFTVGGPVYIPHLYDGRNKTFFFGAAQWDRFFSSAETTLSNVPTPAGVSVLQALSSSCPNVASFLQALGGLRGDPTGFGNPAQVRNISIALTSGTGCDGTNRAGQLVQVGPANRQASQSSLDNNHLVRIDQVVSSKQTMSFRWLYDSTTSGPFFNNFPGFDRGFSGRTFTGAFTDTYIFSPRWVNEFRFNYGRIGFNFPLLAPDTFHGTLPNFAVSGFRGWGGATNIPQFRFANNWQYQDTVTWVHDRHSLRFGVDFLRQLARQHPPFNERGSFSYQPTPGVTGLANFIDDFGGTSGNTQRQFGSSIYHPNLLRQSYFAQDDWKVKQSLTLNLGLRYEYFGQPANGAFLIPAFTNWDPVNFAQPDHVNPDKNNFGPVVGLAWAPHFSSGVFSRMFGEDKTVIRSGFQISYDTFFNNLLSNIAGSSPNTLGGIVVSSVSASQPRGTPNFQSQFSSIQPTPPTALSPQTSLFDSNIRNPYTERWTLEVQRELPLGMVFDVAYVGAEGHKLFQTLDMNPCIAATGCPSASNPAGTRLHNNVGVRSMRASSANSNYHALQVDLKRRYSETPIGNLLLEGAYTYSHAIDTVSEVFNTDSTPSAFESAPQILGFSPNIDRGNADFDRRHTFVLTHVWDVRGPKTGVLGAILGYWTLGGIVSFNTGAPYTVSNGVDRNNDGQTAPDRPEIGNRTAPIASRAIIVPSAVCPSGLQNPDVGGGTCTTASQVFWIQGVGAPGASTVGRNTLFGPGVMNWDLSVSKGFKLSERFLLNYRLDMFNALNHVNLGDTPTGFGLATVNGTPAGSFLDFGLMDAPGRTMRMGLKLTF